jgi:hypothetical protein
MLEMLKRLEDDNDPNDLLDSDDDGYDDGHNALLERFGNIDIENTDPDLIWDLLSDKERKEFEAVLSAGDWNKLQLPTYIPWWKENISLIHDEEEEEERQSRIPELPKTLPDFEKMTQPATRSSPHIAWNLLNILATYSYLMRHAMGDLLEDPQDTMNIAQVLSAHVLYSNVPECPYTSISDVVTDMVGRIIQLEDKTDISKRGKLNNNRRYDLKILLLQDLEDLIKECKRAAADFWRTLDGVTKRKKNKATSLAVRKLYFYLAAACYLDKERTHILNLAIQNELNKTKAEKEEFRKDFEAAQDAMKQHQQQKENEGKIKIQEL